MRTFVGFRKARRASNLQRVTGVQTERRTIRKAPSMSPSSIGRLCAGAAVTLVLFAVATGSSPAGAQTHAEIQTHA